MNRSNLLKKLISKGRLVPITKFLEDGEYIVGFTRRNGSRKSGQEFTLKTPKPIKPRLTNHTPEPAPANNVPYTNPDSKFQLLTSTSL